MRCASTSSTPSPVRSGVGARPTASWSRSWSIRAGEPADEPECAVGHDVPISALAASPSGPLVATGDADGVVCLWSLRDLGGPLWRARLPGEVMSIAWSAGGDDLAAGDVSGAVETWTVTPGTIV